MLRDCGGELGSGGRGEVFTAFNTLEKEGRKSMYVCILGGGEGGGCVEKHVHVINTQDLALDMTLQPNSCNIISVRHPPQIHLCCLSPC